MLVAHAPRRIRAVWGQRMDALPGRLALRKQANQSALRRLISVIWFPSGLNLTSSMKV